MTRSRLNIHHTLRQIKIKALEQMYRPSVITVDGVLIKERPEITDDNIARLAGTGALGDLLVDNVNRNLRNAKNISQSADGDLKDEKVGG